MLSGAKIRTLSDTTFLLCYNSFQICFMAQKSGLHRLMQSTFHYYYLKQSYLFFSFYLFIRATALVLTTDASFTATKFKIIIVLIPFKIVYPVIFSGAKVQPCPYTDKYLGYNIHLLPFFLTKVKTKGIWSPFLRFMRASQPVTCPLFFLYVT